jgi:hypothetical protein
MNIDIDAEADKLLSQLLDGDGTGLTERLFRSRKPPKKLVKQSLAQDVKNHKLDR